MRSWVGKEENVGLGKWRLRRWIIKRRGIDGWRMSVSWGHLRGGKRGRGRGVLLWHRVIAVFLGSCQFYIHRWYHNPILVVQIVLCDCSLWFPDFILLQTSSHLYIAATSSFSFPSKDWLYTELRLSYHLAAFWDAESVLSSWWARAAEVAWD